MLSELGREARRLADRGASATEWAAATLRPLAALEEHLARAASLSAKCGGGHS